MLTYSYTFSLSIFRQLLWAPPWWTFIRSNVFQISVYNYNYNYVIKITIVNKTTIKHALMSAWLIQNGHHGVRVNWFRSHQSIQLICVSATTAKSDRKLTGMSENPELQRSVLQSTPFLFWCYLHWHPGMHPVYAVPQPRTMTGSPEVERTIVTYDVLRYLDGMCHTEGVWAWASMSHPP